MECSVSYIGQQIFLNVKVNECIMSFHKVDSKYITPMMGLYQVIYQHVLLMYR